MDLGFALIKSSKKAKSFKKSIGTFLVNALPKVIKSLSVIGTIALILVLGGIFVHNIEYIHHLLHSLPSMLVEFIVGLVVGFVALVITKIIIAIKTKF